MSQRGSAPRPASRRQSTSRLSPDAATFTQPSSQPPAQAGPSQGDGQRTSTTKTEGPGTAAAEDDGRSFSEEHRVSGVHDIRHAPVARPPFTGSIASVLHGAVEAGNVEYGQGTSRQISIEYAVPPLQPSSIQGEPPLTTTQPRYPPLAPLAPPGPMNLDAQRGSPTIGPALPPIGASRRILTPMSPRAVSLGRGSARVASLQQSQPPLPSNTASGQHMSHQGGPALPGVGLPQIQTLGHSANQPSLPSPGPMRSVSHSVLGRSPLQAMPPEPLLQRPPPFQPSLSGTRDLLPEGQYAPGRWSQGTVRGWPGGLPLQPMFAITPQSGEEILVPVDTQQGSKSADERRLRNAGASQRFRSRKKEKENLMEEETRRLHAIVRDAEHQRDFYRSERNRLRDLVAQTPSISEWANGPPTPPPPSTQHSGPSPEMGNRMIENPTNPTSSRRRTTQTRPHPYESEETSESGPPSRRRRTEHRSNIRFTSPSYDVPPMPRSATLPAIYPQPNLQPPGTIERPQMLGNDARLPPLRLEGLSEQMARPQPLLPQSPLQPHQGPSHGRPPPPLLHGPSQQQTQPEPPNPYGRPPLESGWAVYPRGPQSGGQR